MTLLFFTDKENSQKSLQFLRTFVETVPRILARSAMDKVVTREILISMAPHARKFIFEFPLRELITLRTSFLV